MNLSKLYNPSKKITDLKLRDKVIILDYHETTKVLSQIDTRRLFPIGAKVMVDDIDPNCKNRIPECESCSTNHTCIGLTLKNRNNASMDSSCCYILGDINGRRLI